MLTSRKTSAFFQPRAPKTIWPSTASDLLRPSRVFRCSPPRRLSCLQFRGQICPSHILQRIFRALPFPALAHLCGARRPSWIRKFLIGDSFARSGALGTLEGTRRYAFDSRGWRARSGRASMRPLRGADFLYQDPGTEAAMPSR